MKRKLLFGMTVLFMIIAVMFIGCPDDSPSPTPAEDNNPSTEDGNDDGVIINSNQNDPDATFEDDNIVLTVTVKDEAEVDSYQWYVNNVNNTETGTAIRDANGKSYDPPTDQVGTFYYYVVVTYKNGDKKKSTAFMVKVKLSDGVNAIYPNIATQPKPETRYLTDDEALPLMVVASVPDGGTLTYQWYKNNLDNTTTGTAIQDEKTASYTPPTGTAGVVYYYVEITNTITDNGDNGRKSRTTTSATAKVIVEQGAKAPVITTHPRSALYEYNKPPASLVVAATSLDGGELTYQWYKKLEDSNIAGEKLEGATRTTYLPDVSVNKTLFYYYCEVTNTRTINGAPSSKSAKSNPAYVGVGVKPVTLSGLTVETKIYNKNRNARILGTPVLDPVPTGDVTLIYNAEDAEFVSANVGTGIVVRLIGWHFEGTNAGEYILQLPSLTGTITKAAGSAVPAPVLDDTIALNPTSYKITVKTVGLTDPSTEQSVEYARGANAATAATALTWQASPIFTELGPTVPADYYIYARSKESPNYQAGGTQVSDKISTVVGSAVTKPAVSGDPTDSVITVNAVTLVTATGQSIEYAIGRLTNGTGMSAYQNSTTFNGLDGSTTYYVFARSKANSEWAAGAYTRSDSILTESPIVRFNVDGGTPSIPDRTIEKGLTIDKATVPDISKYRYDFDAWYKDEDFITPYNFNDPVNKSITLYAKWILIADKTLQAQRGLVYIPSGWFTMGSSAVSDAAVHNVGLAGFWMGKYEVTQEEWSRVMGNNPSSFRATVGGEIETPDKLPVEQVSWYSALVYCNKRSIAEDYIPAYLIKTAAYPEGTYYPDLWGAVPTAANSANKAAWDAVTIVEGSDGYRLPTEAQWEYACRAGTITNYSTGDTIANDTGWYTGNSNRMTHKVGQKLATNAWGLYDMHGNVAEWCWDWYDDYAVGAQVNPTGPSSGRVFNKVTGIHANTENGSTFRVFRGGCWGAFVNPPPGVFYNQAFGGGFTSGTYTMLELNSALAARSAVRTPVYLFAAPNYNTTNNYQAYVPIYPYSTHSWIGLRVVRP